MSIFKFSSKGEIIGLSIPKMVDPDKETIALLGLSKMQHMDDSDFLAHYGILGMRWGFRRPTDSNGLVKKGARAVPTEQYIRTKELRKKAGGRGAPYLTNQELREVNERLQLERQFKDLTSKDVSAGRKAANKVLDRVGNKVLDTAVTEGMRMTLSTIGRKPDKK